MACDERSIPCRVPGYDVGEPLGSGGMGVVYRARQVSLNRPVAIKVLARDDDAELAARFRREAELMARIKHPNIATIHDYGYADGHPYLVMEYVEGRDLRGRLDAGPVDLDEVRRLVPALIGALECLHRHGILHRDLKPENILLDRAGQPKLTDFGIAVEGQSIGGLTGGEEWLGTVGYVAPEVQYRLRVDERADQYSLAAVIYELLTGQRPLGVFKSPSQLNPRVPSAADAVLLRALQEDRDDRYAAVGELGAALAAALGEPAPPRPRGRSRREILAGLGLLVLALLAARWFGGPPRRDNRLGMPMVIVPPGEFLMGSTDDDPRAAADERPARRVRLTRPFEIGATEVTVGQFRRFVLEEKYRTVAETNGLGGYRYDAATAALLHDPSCNWRHPDGVRAPADDEPVTQIAYDDAVAFCRWLTRLEGRTYRLPTEAEWEYACRAGASGRRRGDDSDRPDDHAWTARNAGRNAHPVAQRRPNAWGVYDMLGNAWEWCADWYEPYKASRGVVVDPAGPPAGDERVLRGGSWDWYDPSACRPAARLSARPNYAYISYGFRVCAPAP